MASAQPARNISRDPLINRNFAFGRSINDAMVVDDGDNLSISPARAHRECAATDSRSPRYRRSFRNRAPDEGVAGGGGGGDRASHRSAVAQVSHRGGEGLRRDVDSGAELDEASDPRA